MGSDEDDSSLEAASSSSGPSLPKAQLHRLVSLRLNLPHSSVAYVLEETKRGSTVPFLARYRQDQSGHLDEDVIRRVIDTATEVNEVHRRRQFMLKSLAQRGLLTEDLRKTLEKMVHLSQLEDLWEPYKERKTSLAARGREAGLGPLATTLLRTTEPVKHLRETLRRVEDGERLFVAILAEELQRCEGIRQELLAYARKEMVLRTSIVKNARKRAAKELKDADFDHLKKHFGFYDGKTWGVQRIRSHNVLALQRGEAKGVIQVEAVVGSRSYPIFADLAWGQFDGLSRLGRPSRNPRDRGKEATTSGEERYALGLLRQGVQAAYEHLIKSTTNTVRRDLGKRAEHEAILVFAHNLRFMLLQRPLSHSRILAMDPGLSNGVKCVALDENGNLIAFFKCTLMEEDRMRAYIRKIVQTHKLNKVVIGNGTASHRTAQVVASTIAAEKWSDVEFAVVSEAGASVYSASDIAKEEFPSLDILFRGAVSIGRRVLDPLSELVKIPVRSMNIGMYQHDVNEKELMKELNRVVESCVAKVGINAGSANRYVMEKVPGIEKKLVDQVVLARHTKKLNSREDLRKVPGMTDAVYQQVAGFFRFPNSPETLDNTNIHPESYGVVKQLMQRYSAGQLPTMSGGAPTGDSDSPEQQREKLGLLLTRIAEEDFELLAQSVGCGPEALRLVRDELLHPGLDPRASLPHAGLLRKKLITKSSLRKGDVLRGVVTSVTTFGVFVDCGLEDDVLLRGNGVDQLHVGALVENIIFDEMDPIGRIRVQPKDFAQRDVTKEGFAGSGGVRGGVVLESEEMLPGGAADEIDQRLIGQYSLNAELRRAQLEEVEKTEVTGTVAAAVRRRHQPTCNEEASSQSVPMEWGEEEDTEEERPAKQARPEGRTETATNPRGLSPPPSLSRKAPVVVVPKTAMKATFASSTMTATASPVRRESRAKRSRNDDVPPPPLTPIPTTPLRVSAAATDSEKVVMVHDSESESTSSVQEVLSPTTDWVESDSDDGSSDARESPSASCTADLGTGGTASGEKRIPTGKEHGKKRRSRRGGGKTKAAKKTTESPPAVTGAGKGRRPSAASVERMITKDLGEMNL